MPIPRSGDMTDGKRRSLNAQAEAFLESRGSNVSASIDAQLGVLRKSLQGKISRMGLKERTECLTHLNDPTKQAGASGQGIVTRDELQSFLEAIGCTLNIREMLTMIAHLDADGDGVVRVCDLREFLGLASADMPLRPEKQELNHVNRKNRDLLYDGWRDTERESEVIRGLLEQLARSENISAEARIRVHVLEEEKATYMATSHNNSNRYTRFSSFDSHSNSSDKERDWTGKGNNRRMSIATLVSDCQGYDPSFDRGVFFRVQQRLADVYKLDKRTGQVIGKRLDSANGEHDDLMNESVYEAAHLALEEELHDMHKRAADKCEKLDQQLIAEKKKSKALATHAQRLEAMLKDSEAQIIYLSNKAHTRLPSAKSRGQYMANSDESDDEQNDRAHQFSTGTQINRSCASTYGVVQSQVRAFAYVVSACGADLLQELRCQALKEGVSGALDGALSLAGLNTVLKRLAAGSGSVLDLTDFIGSVLQHRHIQDFQDDQSLQLNKKSLRNKQKERSLEWSILTADDVERMAKWFAKQGWIEDSELVFTGSHQHDSESDRIQRIFESEHGDYDYEYNNNNNSNNNMLTSCVWYDQFAACVNRFTEEDAMRAVQQTLHVCREDVTVANAPPRLMATMHTKLVRLASILLFSSPAKTTRVIGFPKTILKGRVLLGFEELNEMVAFVIAGSMRENTSLSRAGGDTVVVGLGGIHHALRFSCDEFGLCMGWFESQGWFMQGRGSGSVGRYHLSQRSDETDSEAEQAEKYTSNEDDIRTNRYGNERKEEDRSKHRGNKADTSRGTFECNEPFTRAGVFWANHALVHVEDWCEALRCFVDAHKLKTDCGWVRRR